MVICDNCSAAVEPSANYCPECGSEITTTRKDWSDGFLTLVDRGHIQEAIDGNESLPEGYHDRLYETVRHALSDFCLLDRWEEFDNKEALVGDLPEEEFDPEDVDELAKLARLLCPSLFMLDALGVDRFTTLIELSVYAHLEETDKSLDDISVSIEIADTDD